MTPRTPESAGVLVGAPLPDRGVARRWRAGEGGELWRLPPPLAEALLAWSARGVGGFELGGVDAQGAWLLRGAGEPRLARQLGSGARWPAARVLALARRLAALLDEGERAGEVLGLHGPESVVLGGLSGFDLRGELLLARRVGGPEPAASPRWCPPETDAGAPWTAAADRWALGVLVYRLLSGQHPFAAEGLRLALDERARGAAPFAEGVSAGLPPGLQALCLRWLGADPAERPASAAALVAELARLDDAALAPGAPAPGPLVSAANEGAAIATGGGAIAPPPPGGGAAIAPPPTRGGPAPARAAPGGWASRFRAGPTPWLLLLLPLVAALGWSLGARPPGAAPAAGVPRRALVPPAPLAESCAGCHPRHVADWRRSVMAHASTSPLFQALEALIEEQVGRDRGCPDGAGILRPHGLGDPAGFSDPAGAGRERAQPCRDEATGEPVTGAGGEGWCVSCHAPGETLTPAVPAWNAHGGGAAARRPLIDLLSPAGREGIGCAVCHQAHGPVRPGAAARGGYEGNPGWRSPSTGRTFDSRPEARRGLFGIANSGYALDPRVLFATDTLAPGDPLTGVHARPDAAARAYLRSSEACGACHDVRLFGTDVIGRERGESFKRLRNAYSEWVDYRDQERARGRDAPTCQGCHMSEYPGVCVPGAPSAEAPSALRRGCPPGYRFEPRAPGSLSTGRVAATSPGAGPVHFHGFAGVDVPLSDALPAALIDDAAVDAHGVPLGLGARRDLLLGAALRLALEAPARRGGRLELPVVVENVGAGHRVPAGFSQEREIWVHLRVTDTRGGVVYEVGRVERGDQDLADKTFLRVNVGDAVRDGRDRPLGMFGADVADGPDAPRWSPPPERGGTEFRGRGLVNFQNGFLRCVVCIGRVDGEGRCQPLPGQERARADRYADGTYDLDTGDCRSNLRGRDALFETYFPVGALDASRGVVKAPDAIIDTRSLPPGVPLRYRYELPAPAGPLRVEARLLFRAFPPFLLRAFVRYEAEQAARGLRPSGPLITERALERLTVVEIARVEARVP